jgi:hypothetical protein
MADMTEVDWASYTRPQLTVTGRVFYDKQYQEYVTIIRVNREIVHPVFSYEHKDKACELMRAKVKKMFDDIKWQMFKRWRGT